MRGTLVIFVKEPRAGRVKTRLGREIGMTVSAWWFRHQTSRLIRTLSDDPRWRTVLAISPETAVQSRAWPAHLHRRRQGRGDLGRRMARVLRACGPGPALIVGADVPAIGRSHIATAFAILGRRDAVIGPATDGGYWLIGLRHPSRAPRTLFDGVRWSTEHARQDTEANLVQFRIGTAATLADVDTAADLSDQPKRSLGSS